MPGLTAAEERLVELLATMGTLDDEALRACAAEVLEARAGGGDVQLGDLLVERELVSVGLIQDLLGSGEGRVFAGEAGEYEAFPKGEDDTAFAVIPPRRKSARRSRKSTGRRRAAALPVDSGEASGGGMEGDPLPISVEPDPDEPSSLPPDVETRRFDLDALAAASATPSEKARPLVPLLGGLGLVLLVGVFGWIASIQPSKKSPPGVAGGSGGAGSAVDGGVDVDVDGGGDGDGDGDGGDPFAVDPGGSGADLLLGEAEAAAGRLEAGGDYQGALRFYRELPAEVRARSPGTIAAAEERLKRLDGHRVEVDALVAEAKQLRHEQELQAGLTKLTEYQQQHPAFAETPAGVRLDGALFQLRQQLEDLRTMVVVDTQKDPETAHVRPEPAERVKAFEALAEQGRRRVEEVRASIAAEDQRVERLREGELERARAASQKAPLDIELLPGFTAHQAIVTGWSAEGFTLDSNGDRLTYAWGSVEPEVALRVRRLGVRENDPEDLLRLGRWCLEQRMFEEARQCFGQAVLLDTRIRDQVPDVTSLARAARIFAGKQDRSGTNLTVTYEFERPAQGGDWELMPKVRGGVNAKASRYEVSGKGICLSSFKEVGFAGRVQVEALLGPTRRGSSAVIGLSLGAGGRKDVRYLAAIERGSGEVLLARQRGGGVKVLERRKGAARGSSVRVTLDLDQDRLRVKIGNRVVCRTNVESEWDRSRIHVGSAADGRGSASFDRITIRGRVRRDWLRKAFGEFDAHLRGLLARTEIRRVYAKPEEEPAAEPLSAEDSYGMAIAGKEARGEYTLGRLKTQRKTSLTLLAAIEAFDKALALAPALAPALYHKALALEQLGRPQLALQLMEQALKSCPRFYEAYSERARMLAKQGRLSEARTSADAAIRIRPDHAPARSAKALTLFSAGDLQGALAELNLALALAPWDDEIRSFRRSVSNVVKGPPWARAHTRETDHYVVRTDISSRRCDDYARELEVIRGFYTQQFGEPTAARKAMVLIFDTREGFHSYAELTTDDRVESLLGYYLPRYRQLLLYEDKDDASLEETRRVLYHEAFHQFIEDLTPVIPHWLNEGFADYYSASQVEGRKVTERGGILDGRLRDLKRFIRQGGPIPFSRLMQETPTEFYSGPVVAKYAQAWSMVHFFLHGASAADRSRFVRYVKLFLEGASTRQAFRKAWDGTEWEPIERAWQAYIQKL